MTLDEAIAILSDMKIDIPVPKAAVTQKKTKCGVRYGNKRIELFGNTEQFRQYQQAGGD